MAQYALFARDAGAEIIGGYHLKLLAWTIGIFAVIFNVSTSIQNVYALNKCTSSIAFLTKTFVALIGFGDFLVGLYLILISIAVIMHISIAVLASSRL